MSMRDFTLKTYQQHLVAMMSYQRPFLRFDEYIALVQKPDCILLRHDVDRKPQNALVMARLEADMGIRASYYFRAGQSTFKPQIIKAIAGMGHEIGYHYECLSEHNGDKVKAMLDFEQNLQRFRAIVPIKTISMHGSPLKPYDNRDMWRKDADRQNLKEHLDVLGELYLDVDYRDIAYVTDTGRNWMAEKGNRRDKVDSSILLNFADCEQLHQYLKNDLHPKMVFQIHPERWTDNRIQWLGQWGKDYLINIAKVVVKKII